MGFLNCQSCSTTSCNTCFGGFIYQQDSSITTSTVNKCYYEPCISTNFNNIYQYILYNSNCKSCSSDNDCNVVCKASNSRSCLSNQYLQLAAGTCGALFFGSCQSKSPAIAPQNFFVGTKGVNLVETKTTFSGSGTFASPYPDLLQAIINIYQTAANYQSYNATIYLLNEDHFILNKDYTSIALTKLDYNPQLSITIQPLYCSSLYTTNCFPSSSAIANVYVRYPQTVLYIFSNLVINNVIFDAIEMLNTNDLTRTVKCTLNNATSINPTFSDQTCQTAYNNMQ